MFVSKKQEVYIKGFKNFEAGTFKGRDGEDIPYDAFKQVTFSVFNKNGELIDVKCRIPNNEQGENIYVGLRNLNLMTKLFADFEIQIAPSGSAKYFIVGYEVAK